MQTKIFRINKKNPVRNSYHTSSGAEYLNIASAISELFPSAMALWPARAPTEPCGKFARFNLVDSSEFCPNCEGSGR